MMKSISVAVILLAAFWLLSAGSPVFAHNGDIGSESDPIQIDVMTDADIGSHTDAYDWKGWATIYLKNICGQDWGDFHFRVYSLLGSSVYFPDLPAYQPELYTRTSLLDPWVPITDLTPQWSTDHKTLDLTYYDDPIVHNEWAKFRVYTDNTSECLSLFFIAGHPTPVPEPATIALISLGGLALLKRKQKI